MSKINDLKGKRFGRLKVIARAPTKITPSGRYRTMWLCRCDCGTEKVIGACNLKRTDRLATQSCGCLQKEATASKDWLGVEYRRYQKHNQRSCSIRPNRPKEFGLTREQFKELITSNCFYCGQKPHMKTHVGGRKRNGIDRLDVSIGYLKNNCVSCCRDCNRMKGSLSFQEFVGQCSLIAKAHKEIK